VDHVIAMPHTKWMGLIVLAVITIAALAAFLGPPTDSPAVTEIVRRTVDEVLLLLQDKELKQPARSSRRRQLIEEAVGRRFDYEEMAKRSLAAHWKTLDQAQRREFVTLFQQLLSNQYAKRIERYSGEQVKYVKERREGPYAEVQTTIASAKDEISVNYRLLNTSGEWRVYDVVIEGVSLVSNYRGQFDRIIRSESYAGLLEKLRTRSEEIKSA
jgi:phospholipid transport system substrate-binding protein